MDISKKTFQKYASVFPAFHINQENPKNSPNINEKVQKLKILHFFEKLVDGGIFLRYNSIPIGLVI
jgi:hypothetical protein